MAEDFDNFNDFEAKDTAHTLPIGWLLLFGGLILFGIFYTIAYTPSFSGWSQEKAYIESVKK
jgi:hypothetical protein